MELLPLRIIDNFVQAALSSYSVPNSAQDSDQATEKGIKNQCSVTGGARRQCGVQAVNSVGRLLICVRVMIIERLGSTIPGKVRRGGNALGSTWHSLLFSSITSAKAIHVDRLILLCLLMSGRDARNRSG